MIDWDRVAELRDEVGEDDFAEVMALFLEETEEAAIRLASETGDAGQIARDLHFLKGSALNMGFSDLAALCQAGERRARQGDGGVDRSAILKCFHDSRSALEAGKARPAA